MAVLCVDAGTTMVKAVLFDEEGHELRVARQATQVRRGGPGFSEQDMDGVWDAVVSTVRALVRAGREPVRTLAFTGQGDGCWLVGPDGRPTGPAILWNDGRACDIIDRWEAGGVLDAAFKINGNYGFAGTSGAILAWLRAHDRERLDASHKALYCGGWLFLRLTGEYAAEESDAASPFLDIRTRAYAPEILDLLGMPWAERLLPGIRGDGDRIGQLRTLAAAELGLPAGLPVVMAPFDIPATALGIGAVTPGQACVILGTTLSIATPVAAVDTSCTPSGMTLPSGVPGGYLRSLAAMAGIEAIGWGMDLMGLGEPGGISDLAQAADPGADGLFFHPYLSPAGERAPFRDTRARGSLSGLTFEHTKAHITRAMLEGMSYVVRECLECSGAHATELRITGGGANSDFWCRLLADVTGVPTMRSADTELGAKGAFIAALVATGAEPSVRAAVERHVRPRDVFEPDDKRSALYDDLYGDFLTLRDGARIHWNRLAVSRARCRGD
ncbi:FGGY-family carbohydrate kinase [Nonomuraea sp. SYSU D8015]|uniref:FGGY-family carbohydrate kinase n=1 Tax=Nonomuraea sp. SYSU D8015 TaxID=2593644 RepID=UPI0016616EAA|nr:FGGY-family carbohydrate kinase [Nonomuraea sp. SYSU D8015]